MADNDIKSILEKLGSTFDTSSIDNIAASLDDLYKTTIKLGDTRTIRQLINLKQAIKGLEQELEEETKLKEKLKDIDKETYENKEKLIKQIDENQRKIKSHSSVVSEAQRAQKRAYEGNVETLKKLEEAQREAFDSTVVGKFSKAASGSLAKYVAAIGAASLAHKAFNRTAEASQVRTDIIIRNFTDLNEISNNMSEDLISGTAKSAASIFEFEKAIRDARVTAIRMGIDVSEVSSAMVKFARITGERTPEKLSTLTKGALTISKTMNIDMSEAIDFVTLRMQKFGGTSVSALNSLVSIRKETEEVNKTFGRTVLRTDDLIQSMIEIGRQSNIYALDQRHVTKILSDSILRLQTMGESYQNALKYSKEYASAVTGKAPEWMQVLAGQDIVGHMMKAWGKGGKEGIKTFEAEFGDALDKAKPGLSKKIQDILQSDRGYYEKVRLIQEITNATEIGTDALNKQIVSLGKYADGAVLVQKQFGLESLAAADALIQSAKKEEEIRARSVNLAKLDADQLSKQAGISKTLASHLVSKKESIRDYLKSQERTTANLTMQAQVSKELESYHANVARLEGQRSELISQRGKLQKALESAEDSGDKDKIKKLQGEINYYETGIKDIDDRLTQQTSERLEAVLGQRQKDLSLKLKDIKVRLESDVSDSEKSRLEEEKAKLEAQQADLLKIAKREKKGEDVLQKSIAEVENQFLADAATQGRLLKELVEVVSSPLLLAGVATALGALNALTFFTNSKLASIDSILYKIYLKGSMGGGAGGGGLSTPKGRGNKVTRAIARSKRAVKRGASKVAGGAKDLALRTTNPLKSSKVLSLLKHPKLKGILKAGALVAGASGLMASIGAKAAEIEESDKTLGKNIDGLNKGIELSQKQLDGAAEKLDSAGNKLDGSGSTLKDTSSKLRSVPKEMDDSKLKKSADGLADSVEDLSGAVEDSSFGFGEITTMLGLGTLLGGGALLGKRKMASRPKAPKAMSKANSGIKGIGKKIPYLGAALAAYELADVAGGDAMEGSYGEAALKSLPTIASLAGGALGSLAGGALGSLAGPAGTGIGGFAGYSAGSSLGDELGSYMETWIRSLSDSGQDTKKALTKTNTLIAESQKMIKGQQAGVELPSLPTAQTLSVSSSPGGLEGSIEGPFSDGSISIRIPNYMETYAKSVNMARRS